MILMKCSKCKKKAAFKSQDGKKYYCEDHAIGYLKDPKHDGFLPRL